MTRVHINKHRSVCAQKVFPPSYLFCQIFFSDLCHSFLGARLDLSVSPNEKQVVFQSLAKKFVFAGVDQALQVLRIRWQTNITQNVHSLPSEKGENGH